MTGMDGFETCRRLKAGKTTRTIPIIFMTVLGDTDHIVTGFKAGAADYVTKPIRIPELLARIQTQLELRRFQAELKSRIGGLQQEVDKRLQMENQIRFLNQELIRAQERERHKIAYELHEKVAQDLVALKIIADNIDGRQLPRHEASILSMRLETILHNIKAMTHQLHPQLLDVFGIQQSVTAYCQDFSARHALPVEVDCTALPIAGSTWIRKSICSGSSRRGSIISCAGQHPRGPKCTECR